MLGSINDALAYRWIDPEELESLKSGAFLNKAKNGLAQRTHKAFSLNPNLKFLARKVMVAVPLTASMRDSIHCVCYTALPRDIIGVIRNRKSVSL